MTSALQYTSWNLWIMIWNPQATSSNPPATCSNPRVQESFNLWRLHMIFAKYGMILKYRVCLRFYLIKIVSVLDNYGLACKK